MATLEDHHLTGFSQRQAEDRQSKRQREDNEDKRSEASDDGFNEQNGNQQSYESQQAQPLD